MDEVQWQLLGDLGPNLSVINMHQKSSLSHGFYIYKTDLVILALLRSWPNHAKYCL